MSNNALPAPAPGLLRNGGKSLKLKFHMNSSAYFENTRTVPPYLGFVPAMQLLRIAIFLMNKPFFKYSSRRPFFPCKISRLRPFEVDSAMLIFLAMFFENTNLFAFSAHPPPPFICARAEPVEVVLLQQVFLSCSFLVRSYEALTTHVICVRSKPRPTPFC